MKLTHMSNSLLNRADLIEVFTIFDGKKKDADAIFEYSHYDQKWHISRKDSGWGFVPVTKADIIRAFENDFRGVGDAGRYMEAIVYKNGKVIGVISTYDEPEALKGFKTVMYGRKGHRDAVVQLENSVRKMF